MTELVIIIVEDEPEVRAAIVRDLAPLAVGVRIDQASNVDDARSALSEAENAGDVVGLILADHRLPGESGVDLLVSIKQDPERQMIRTMLITGQAGHDDTIRAINDADLDHYFSKPWDPNELAAVAVRLLTDFVIDVGIEPLRYVRELDGPRLMAAFAKHGRPD